MAEYRLSPKAQHDLDELFDYTVARWGFEQATRYTDRVEGACVDLAAAPLRAQDCGHVRPGYRRRGVGQHVIYFRPTAYGIAVMRILHERMDVARHL